MPAGYERYRMLYGAEVWTCDKMPRDQVITFGVGQFAFAPKTVVVLCGDNTTAKRVSDILADVSMEQMLKELDSHGHTPSS